jgi:sugar phosphate isomerase/epimerase
MKIGLYSITYLGAWYRGPALSIEELIARARTYGYDGVEIDGKRPHGNPLDLPKQRCADLRMKAGDAGVEIYAVAANNDFSSPIPEYREAQLLYVRDLIRMTADLGVKTLRMFAAWPGLTLSPEGARYTKARQLWRDAHLEYSAEEIWDWCRAGLIESAAWAAERGVTLALQNHAPVTNSPADMLRMIREVDSPQVKACFDAPMARRQGVDAAGMQEAARAVSGLQVLSHFGGEYERDAEGIVRGFDRNPDMTLTPLDYYVEFALGMREIGYDGYIGYELCHPLPLVDGQTVGIEFADRNAQLAVEYMRGIVQTAARSEPARAHAG